MVGYGLCPPPIFLNANAVLVGVVGFEPLPLLAIPDTYNVLGGAREVRSGAVLRLDLAALGQRTRESKPRPMSLGPGSLQMSP